MEIIDQRKAEHYIWGEVCNGWHYLKTDELSIIREKVPQGKEEVKHYHNKAQQFFYILKGEATFIIDNKKKKLNEGQGIHIPPKTIHQLINESHSDLEFIVISNPKSHGDRTIVK